MYQRITILGRLGGDPVMRYTPQGKAVANFDLAVDKHRGGQKETTWFRVTVWERQAEAVNQYLRKGDTALADGEVDVSTYTKHDGTTGVSLNVNASRVVFVHTKGATVAEPASGSAPRRDILDEEDILF